MPKNNITENGTRYRYKDSDGKWKGLKRKKNEKLSDFRKRCDEVDRFSDMNVPTDLTLTELFFKFNTEHQAISCSQSDTEKSQYYFEHYIRPYLGHRRVTSLKRQDIFEFLTQMEIKGYSANTIRLVRSCISRPYNWAINSLGWEMPCPTDGLSKRKKRAVVLEDEENKKESGIRTITEEEEIRFFTAAASSKYLNYFLVLRYSGARPSEGLGLKSTDDKGDKLQIRRAITEYGLGPPKTKKGVRDIPISPNLRKVLDAPKRDHSEWLFPTEEELPSMNAIKSAFKRIVKQTAVWKKVDRKYHGELLVPPVDFNLYNFRHTFATDAARVLQPNQLMYIMGHENIETTLKYYVGLDEQDRLSAAEGLSSIYS